MILASEAIDVTLDLRIDAGLLPCQAIPKQCRNPEGVCKQRATAFVCRRKKGIMESRVHALLWFKRIVLALFSPEIYETVLKLLIKRNNIILILCCIYSRYVVV